MIPVQVTVGPIASADDDFFVVSVTPTSGTALTLAAATPATPRRVLATYGNELSARTLRITGTNDDDNPIRETLTIPSGAGGTLATVQDFASVTEAMPLGGGWTAALKVGTNGVASSPWKLTNSQQQANTQISWGADITGTANVSVEYTYSNVNSNQYQMGGALGNYPDVPTVAGTIPGLSGITADADGAIDNPISAWRVVLNSGTGSVVVTSIEGGMI